MNANDETKNAVPPVQVPQTPVPAQTTVGIVNEEGVRESESFEITRPKTDKKNVVEVTSKETGASRLIHKDRVIKSVKNQTQESKPTKTTKKSKKKLEKFDVSTLKGIGTLFRYKKIKHHKCTTSNMNVEAFCLVSNDHKKWRYFNLYSGSLGKKNKIPEFNDKDKITNEDISGDIKLIEEYLAAKEYLRV